MLKCITLNNKLPTSCNIVGTNQLLWMKITVHAFCYIHCSIFVTSNIVWFPESCWIWFKRIIQSNTARETPWTFYTKRVCLVANILMIVTLKNENKIITIFNISIYHAISIFQHNLVWKNL